MKRLLLLVALLAVGQAFATNGRETISDVRVAPLLQSRWGQKLDTGYDNVGDWCFNFYTPNHDPCGCSATAMAQVMRYWQYPAIAPAGSYVCAIDGTRTTRSISAGAYDYANMPLDTRAGIPEAQRKAIGKLTCDCAVALHTSFGTAGSSAYSDFAFSILTDTFGYANAMGYCPVGGVSFADVKAAIFANFDLGCPVMLSLLTSGNVGHQVLADGYGFEGGVAYVHLVCGWPQKSDLCDRWYALPDVETDKYAFTKIDGIVYNVFPQETGDILSGRVLDASGRPVANAAVTVSGVGIASGTDVTDANGIYAFLLPGGKTYTVSCDGASKKVTLAKSVSAVCSWTDPLNPFLPDSRKTGTCGNSWGNDLVLGGGGSSEPSGEFNPTKAAVWSGVRLTGGVPTGVAQVKIGKASKGTSKVSVTVIGIDGKKYSSKSVKVSTGTAATGRFEVKGLGGLTLTFGADDFAGTFDGGDILKSDTGTVATTPGYATFTATDLSSVANALTEYLPAGEAVTRTAKKWSVVAKAGKLKYVKPNAKKGVAGGLQATGSNIAGLKLTYAAKTQTFKGSFKIWTFDSAKNKLKSVSATVTGVVVNGTGYGQAKVKKSVVGDLTVE